MARLLLRDPCSVNGGSLRACGVSRFRCTSALRLLTSERRQLGCRTPRLAVAEIFGVGGGVAQVVVDQDRRLAR